MFRLNDHLQIVQNPFSTANREAGTSTEIEPASPSLIKLSMGLGRNPPKGCP